MFTVTGTDPEGIGYVVGVHPTPVNDPEAVGVAKGSMNAMLLLSQNRGEIMKVTPTGPFITLDINSPAAVLAALHALTTVTRVDGEDVPELLGPDDMQPGVIY